MSPKKETLIFSSFYFEQNVEKLIKIECNAINYRDDNEKIIPSEAYKNLQKKI